MKSVFILRGEYNFACNFDQRDGVVTDASGLYYLRARYYSPELISFINEDTYKGTLSSSQTLNNYIYANGNPVSMVDPFGRTTYQIGISVSGAMFWNVSLSFGFAWDDKGNTTFIFSQSGNPIKSDDPKAPKQTPAGGLFGIGGQLFFQVTDAPKASDLEGDGFNIGANFGPGWYLGGDAVWVGKPDHHPDGGQINVGIGLGVDIHGGASDTTLIGYSQTHIENSKTSYSRQLFEDK